VFILWALREVKDIESIKGSAGQHTF